METRWRIELLGGLRVTREAHCAARFRTRKAASLLAYLAFHPGVHAREILVEMLWPEAEPQAGRNRLRVTLSALRVALKNCGKDGEEDALLIARRDGIGLEANSFSSDVAEFNAHLKQARAAPQIDERVSHLIAAVEIYRPLLPGFYEDWVAPAEQRLEETYAQALRELTALWRGQGEVLRAIEYARRGVEVAPLREELHTELVQLYLAADRPAAARRQYAELERVLHPQFNGASVAAAALLSAIETAENNFAKNDVVENDVAATGSSRPGVLPACEAATPASALPSFNAPPYFTRFVGRQTECAELQKILLHSKTRLLSLTGPGGIGKTRLAAQVAEQACAQWPHRVWFVPLADSSEAETMAEAIALALHLPADSAATKDEILERITDAIGEAPSLLVLDNFEQLLPWGTPVVQHLLQRALHLKVLVTSRERLGLEDEREFLTPTLPAPDLTKNDLMKNGKWARGRDALLQFESVQLFVERAAAARPGFQLSRHNAAAIAQLCARLDGLPLALELAAARAKNISPSQMLSRLDERLDFLTGAPPASAYRHRSLRAAQEWSFDLLAPNLRLFFAVLGVFRGGFSLEAARDVSENSNAAHYLSQLVAASFVTADGKRFRLLETIREFALERLPRREYSGAQQRHTHCFLQIALARETEFTKGDEAQRMASQARSNLDAENFRAALAWSSEEEPETALRLVVALSHFWGDCSLDSAERAERVLDKAKDAPISLISAALGVASHRAGQRGDHQRHRELALRRLALAREMGDDCEIAWALFHVGDAAYLQGDTNAASEVFAASLRLFQKHQDGSACHRQNLAWTLNSLGKCALGREQMERAAAYFKRSENAFRAAADRDGQASELCQRADVFARQGKLNQARKLFARAAEFERALGDPRPHPWRRLQRAYLAWRENDLSGARELLLGALRGFEETSEMSGTLRTLLALGCVGAAQARFEEAALLLGAETAARAARNLPVSIEWAQPREAALQTLQHALGESELEKLLAQEKTLSLRAVVARALRQSELK